MTYCTIDVVYGWNLTDHPDLQLENAEGDTFQEILDDLSGIDASFVLQPYNGNGETQQAFGIVIDSFDECQPMPLTGFKHEPSPEEITQLADAAKEFELSERLLQGEPSVFLLFGSS